MNSLFGDATSQMPTPATLAEAESLFGGRSPVPSLDIRNQQRFGADSAIPGLDINPPNVPDSSDAREGGEGAGGWISNLVKNVRGGKDDDDKSGKYKQVNQDEGD